MKKKNSILPAIAFFLLTPFAVYSQIAASTNFTLEKAVVATGGGESAGTTFSVRGTAGQPAAGQTSGTTFQLQGGFWSANPVAPTAAGVTVAGRILSADGRGLRNAVVYLTDADGTTRSTRTGSFGYYRFDGIAAGQIVVIGVSSKLYRFEPRVLILNDSLADIDFTPAEENRKRIEP
jgi:hypothetical protein